MIKYTLKCENSHQFDGWFSSSQTYDMQHEQGLVTCPVCDTHTVEKQLMAPAVTGTKKQKAQFIDHQTTESERDTQDDGSSLPAHSPQPAPVIQPDKTVAAVVEKMRELKQWVEANSDNVGDQFAEKARKMHYGEEDRRNIVGQTTSEEARELVEEGVPFMPLPTLPEENN